MPLLVSRATGNFTDAATWGVADSATGSQLTAPTASTTTTTSYVYSSTFTGTNTKVADGVAIFLSRVNTTGTFSVALSDDNGVTATRSVTVNASDLPTSTAWVFFKFGTTLTLDGGTDYRVGILGSSAGNVTVYRDATAGNWARIISTTDTAAPAAGDTMLIVGELTGAGASNSFTVTMNNTATTDFGNGTATATAPTQTNPQNFNGIQIGNKGTLTWGTSAATAYYLKLSGNLLVWAGGTYNMGTVATPCPRDSSMYLQLDCAADGDFGVLFFSGSTANIQGQSRTSGKNVWFCKLNTDEAINSTSLGVDTDTGWLDNDEIVVATTTRTAAQSENGTLNGAAGASTLTVDGFAGAGGGLANAHSGTAPTQAEVVLLTRNVRISGGAAGLTTYIYMGTTATCDFDWAEFFWIGAASSGAKIGFNVDIASGGTVDIQYCCLRNADFGPFLQAATSFGTGSLILSNNVFWRANLSFQRNANTGTLTVENNICLNNNSSGTQYSFLSGSFNGNTSIGGSIGFDMSNGLAVAEFKNNTAHGQASAGVRFVNMTGSNIIIPVVQNITCWRTNGNGVIISNTNPIAIDGLTSFGNTSDGLNITRSYVEINNALLAGDTTFSQPRGVNTTDYVSVKMQNSTLGVASGIYVAHSTNDITVGSVGYAFIDLNNTILASSTEVSTLNFLTPTYIKSSRHDQTAGAFRSWFQGGRIDRDTTIFNTAAPSERLTPSSASIKLVSGSRLVAVDDNGTVTINAYVRKSTAGDGAAYNGNQPRLILKANPACGINSDTVLDTMTVGTGTWEQLTGTTAAVDADGALEFVVDCDGTAGWVNVDDWTVT